MRKPTRPLQCSMLALTLTLAFATAANVPVSGSNTPTLILFGSSACAPPTPKAPQNTEIASSPHNFFISVSLQHLCMRTLAMSFEK